VQVFQRLLEEAGCCGHFELGGDGVSFAVSWGWGWFGGGVREAHN
jgi:hypothetical protein